VPHPFAFFLANGWDTTNLNRIAQEELRLDSSPNYPWPPSIESTTLEATADAETL
jgi:hypothetical protein